MSFLTPWLGLLGLLALPVVVAFLNRRRVRERTVPSLILLRQLRSDRPSQRSFAMPRHWLALLLYLLALAGVVFASSQPVLPDSEPETLILVVDTSASMAAREPGQEQGRLARAVLELDEKILDSLDARDEVALVQMGAESRIVLEPTRDVERVREQLASLHVAGRAVDSGRAIALASAMCRARQRARIVVVTDGASDLPDPTTLGCDAMISLVGEAAPNLAITQFALRDADGLGLIEAFVEITNTGNKTREVSVEIELDGILVEVVALEVAPSKPTGQLVKFQAPTGQIVSAKLSASDGNALALDDEAWAARPANAKARVAFVSTRPTSFAAEALSLHPRVELRRFKTGEPIPAEPWDLVVFDDAPTQGALEALPKQASVALLGADTSAVGIARAEKVERPGVTWWDFDAPLLRYVDLDVVEILEARPLVPRDGDEVLVKAGPKDALMLVREIDGRRVLAFGFEIEQSDFVLRVAFANFMANLIDWTHALERAKPPVETRPGAMVLGAQDDWELVPAAGERAQKFELTSPIPDVGVWIARDASGEPQRTFVSNALSPEEAKLEAREGIAAWERLPDVDVSEGSADWLWRLPLILAIALLLIEAVLPGFRRKREQRTGSDRRAALEAIANRRSS